jgi:hypothetical protein
MYTVEALVRRVATRSRCLTWEDLETIEADVIVLPGLRHRQDPYGIE